MKKQRTTIVKVYECVPSYLSRTVLYLLHLVAFEPPESCVETFSKLGITIVSVALGLHTMV